MHSSEMAYPSPAPGRGGIAALAIALLLIVAVLVGSAVLRSQQDTPEEDGSSSSSGNPALEEALGDLERAATAEEAVAALDRAADAAAAEDGWPPSGSVEELRALQLDDLARALEAAGSVTPQQLREVREIARRVAGYDFTGDANDRRDLDRVLRGLQP